MTKDNYKARVLGSIMGGAVGDALGRQIEFKRGVKDKEITEYQASVGIITDDTQMTLFTANALLFRTTRLYIKGIALLPVDAVYEAYIDWFEAQEHLEYRKYPVAWLKYLETMRSRRAPGRTCLSALRSGVKGTIERPFNGSKGCGGIMRVAPFGLYMKDPEIAGQFAAEAAAITHGHPLGIIPAYVFGTLIWYLVFEELDIRIALDKAIQQYKEKFDVFDQEYRKHFLKLIDETIKLSEQGPPNASDPKQIQYLGEGWCADETLAIALFACLKYPNSFQDAIVCAINHDGDSDSTGSVAGNIMGAYLGYDAIPDQYKDNIEIKDVILEIANNLADGPPQDIMNDKYWWSKYVLCKRDLNLRKAT